VKRVSDVDLSSATDEEIMRYASRNECIIVTRDLGFGTLAVYRKVPVYGVMILRLPFTATASMINQVLDTFLSTVDPGELAHSLVVVEMNRYRIRKL
jgi:predicted nuclease of predicted toxin-antitoxin system